MALKNNPFIWLSGADPDALEISTIAEKRKYIKLGLTILIPTIMGWVGMWFASPYIGISESYRIIASSIWSLIILIIDTYLVSSLNYKKAFSKGQKFGYFTLALFRILLAIFIGIVISHPIVLKILESNINEEIQNIKNEKLAEIISRNRDSTNSWSQRLVFERAEVDSNLQCNKILLRAEVNGRLLNSSCGSTSGTRNVGIRYREISGEISKLERKRDSLSSAIREIHTDFASRTKSDTSNFNKTFSADYLKRMQAVHRLKNNKNTSEPTKTLTNVLLIFFVLLDSIAVISKVMVSSDDYESNYTKIKEAKSVTEFSKLSNKAKIETAYFEQDRQYTDALIEAVLQQSSNYPINQIRETINEILNGSAGISNGSSVPKQYLTLKIILFLLITLLCALILFFVLRYYKVSNDIISIFMGIYTTIVPIFQLLFLK